MRASNSVKTEELSDETSFAPPVPVCLAEAAEGWLRAHHYGRDSVGPTRLQILAMCALTGHTKCAQRLWLHGLPQGADAYAWDGTQPEGKVT